VAAGVGAALLAVGATVGEGACVAVIDGVAVRVGKVVASGKGVLVRAVAVAVGVL
jgi:hypothetical protein